MKDLTESSIKPLSVFQIKQKQFILSEYPMLDDMMVETIVRLKEGQIENIVRDMKSGKLIPHEEAKTPEEYILQSVSVE